MQKKIRILQVVTIMNRGGTESMIMNYYRTLNRDLYQFDFLVHRQEKGDYDEEIEAMGGRIYRMFPIRPYNYWKYFKSLDSFFKIHSTDFKAIHCHIQENSGFSLKYAAKYGIKNRLCTSHCAGVTFDYKYIFRCFASYFLRKYVTSRLSCGKLAGDALYGEQKYEILHNAINAHLFDFNLTTRNKMRDDLNLGNNLVLGNVARLSPEKNHLFLIEVFRELHKRVPESKMIFVGEGCMRKQIEEKIHKYKLENYILILGLRNDIHCLLQAFDLFVFPSVFEGLPVSLIEAQASGLKCIVSENVDNAVKITSNVAFSKIDNTHVWVDLIISQRQYTRKSVLEDIIKAGYDVNKNIDYLMGMYLA